MTVIHDISEIKFTMVRLFDLKDLRMLPSSSKKVLLRIWTGMLRNF